jgi:hypothetical protein
VYVEDHEFMAVDKIDFSLFINNALFMLTGVVSEVLLKLLHQLNVLINF